MRRFAFVSTFLTFAAFVAPLFAAEPIVSDVEFVAKFDGSSQRYLEILPPNYDAARPAPILVVLHGHGSDRTQIVNEAVHEFRAMRDVAAERGAIVVSPDYRAATSWLGPAAEADLVQILEEIAAKRPIGKIVVSGASMGGASALTFAVRRPDLTAGVVSMNGTANHLEYELFQDAISASFGGSKTEIPLEYKNRSGEYFPELFVDKPLALTLGGRDEIVPSTSAARLAETIKKIGGNVLVIFQPDGGHATNYKDSREAAEFVFDALGIPKI